MRELFGAGLLAASGLLWGCMAAARQREAVRRCAALCRMLELMAFELLRFRTPLPELFSALSKGLEEPAAGLCAAAAAALERGDVFSGAWAALCGERLTPRERELLQPLGRILGRYGAEEQASAVETCRGMAERYGVQLRSELRERSRVYIGAGAAGGVMLAVLLL